MAGNEAEALAAHQDGMPFSAWVKQAGCARSTAAKWAEACAVRIRMEVNPASGRQESWLSGHDVAVLNDYRRQLDGGQKPSATLVSLTPGGQVLPAAWLPQAPEPAAANRWVPPSAPRKPPCCWGSAPAAIPSAAPASRPVAWAAISGSCARPSL